jgi:hypothetical protein
MRAPSNRSGIPTLPIVGLLGLILFLGFALAPAAFEFRAWPEPSRPVAIEEIVARPAQPVTEVPVVVRAKSKRADSLGVRGRSPRRPSEARLDSRGSATRGGSTRGHSRDARKGDGAPAVAPDDVVVVVEETPAPEPVAPVGEPEQPAQLAEVPSSDHVMRPEAEALPPAKTPEPLRSYDAQQYDREAGECDYAGEHRGRGRHGRGHGHGNGHDGSSGSD